MFQLLSVLIHMSSADFYKMLFVILLQGLMHVILCLHETAPLKKTSKNKREKEREF